MLGLHLSRAQQEEDKDENVALAFGLVAAAGFSTTFGAAMVFFDCFFSRHNYSVLGGALGFSGGVMLYVSMIEIFPEAISEFEECECLWGDDEDEDSNFAAAYVLATLCFFIGVVIVYMLDSLVHCILKKTGHAHGHLDLPPREANPYGDEDKELLASDPVKRAAEAMPNMVDRDDLDKDNVAHQKPHGASRESADEIEIEDGNPPASKPIAQEDGTTGATSEIDAEERTKLETMGLLTAIAIGIHNFPEGLATFAATLADPTVGITLAIAIAIHNIPEGLCVAVPIYYATGSRWKGFFIAFWSGISELIGALLGYAFLISILGTAAYGVLFAVVAGMMVTIVLKELIPTAHRYDTDDKYVTKCVFVGSAVMALSLVLFLF